MTTDAVLGLHVGLNSAAALVTVEGDLVWAEQEERHSRIKNHCGFPTQAVRAAGHQASQAKLHINAVGVGGTRTVYPDDRSRKDLQAAYTRVYEQLLIGDPADIDGQRAEEARRTVQRLTQAALPGVSDVRFFDHHLCHAAAAYHFLRQDNDPYLVVTLDGEGDGHAGSVWVAQEGKLDPVATTPREASAGMLYFWATFLLSLMPHEDEHKVMGLAGYIDRDIAAAVADQHFNGLLDVDPDALSLVIPPARHPGTWLAELTRRCQRLRFDHLAAAAQHQIETLATRLVEATIAKTGIRRVLLGGGLFMNVKVNQTIRHLHATDLVDAMPSAGDESLAIGAAYLAATQLAGPLPLASPDIYQGSRPTPNDLANARQAARSFGCTARATGSGAIEAAVEALATGEPVGICTGRAEWGARALGHRSLLADPSAPKAVQHLNRAIKQRDWWMPFAPVLFDARGSQALTDHAGPPSRWMMHAYNAAADERLRGAVHPGDWTCRPQMLPDDSTEPVAQILRAVEDQHGLPALINTSLNLHGQPLARTAQDAVQILQHSPLRYLLLNGELLAR